MEYPTEMDRQYSFVNLDHSSFRSGQTGLRLPLLLKAVPLELVGP